MIDNGLSGTGTRIGLGEIATGEEKTEGVNGRGGFGGRGGVDREGSAQCSCGNRGARTVVRRVLMSGRRSIVGRHG